MKRLIFSLMFFFFAFQIDVFAQKFEKESRLKPEDVPPAAQEFIRSANLNTSWKWYFEENLKGNSVEAKTKYNGKRYSIEFDTSGKIQDVEVETRLTELDENISRNLRQVLDSIFTSHNIQKIQVQYASESSVLLAILKNEAESSAATVQYEMVVKGKKTGRPKLYELIFSDNGRLIESSEIIFRNTDNLEY